MYSVFQVPGERDDGEVGMAGKKTIETMQGVNNILDTPTVHWCLYIVVYCDWLIIAGWTNNGSFRNI